MADRVHLEHWGTGKRGSPFCLTGWTDGTHIVLSAEEDKATDRQFDTALVLHYPGVAFTVRLEDGYRVARSN